MLYVGLIYIHLFRMSSIDINETGKIMKKRLCECRMPGQKKEPLFTRFFGNVILPELAFLVPELPQVSGAAVSRREWPQAVLISLFS